MKKVFLMIALVAGLGVAANAQTKPGHKVKDPAQRAQLRTAALTKKLNLSADQSAKVKAVFDKQAVQMDSLKANRSTDRKANMQARKAIFANTDANLKGILTAEQQTAYSGLKANMHKRFEGRRPAKNPEQKAQRYTKVLTKKLSLSADQSAKVNAILLKSATEIKDLKASKPADRKSGMEARKTILLNTDAQLKTVFNADQQKQYAELKAKMIERFKARRGAKTATPNAG
ncbi:hypothetical protein ACFQZX_14885 [Mucilaginibacter litoreus]|uniref:LTXXQ motif family protein n=1 Tax=Mucilaginibacter litoreus TaxID=1048221 RepID=A0ABW3AVP2_9SPHI